MGWASVAAGFEFNQEALVIDVKPSWQVPRCSECLRKGTKEGGRTRTWRHLDLGGIKCELRYSIRRVKCPCCGVKTEAVPWADAASWFTRPFEQHRTYLAKATDKTTVSKLMRVSWVTVGNTASVSRPTQSAVVFGPDELGPMLLTEMAESEHMPDVIGGLQIVEGGA